MASPTRVPDLDDLRRMRDDIERLARRNRISNVRVVGSVARGDPRPDSDVDFLVDLDPPIGGFEAAARLDRLERQLRRLLGWPVHVVTVGTDQRFARRILQDAQPL